MSGGRQLSLAAYRGGICNVLRMKDPRRVWSVCLVPLACRLVQEAFIYCAVDRVDLREDGSRGSRG